MSNLNIKCNVLNEEDIYNFRLMIFRENKILYEEEMTSQDILRISNLNSNTDYIVVFPENAIFYPENITLFPKRINANYILNFTCINSLQIKVRIVDENYSKLTIQKGNLKLWQTNTISQ